MKLALFDLDHTLLPIDSADTWSYYVMRAGKLDADEYTRRIRHFAQTYKEGTFDVEGYLGFQMEMLAAFPRPKLELWRAEYLRAHVLPAIRLEALELIDGHRRTGYTCALVTGTHQFVTRPIAAALGLEHLLAVQPEEHEGRFTGRYVGTHTYLEGKVRAVDAFLAERRTTLDQCEDSVFYSDSINDLPLLQRVRVPVVTNGDQKIRAVAAERGWRVLDLFETVHAA